MNDPQVVSIQVGSPRLGWLQPNGCSEMPPRGKRIMGCCVATGRNFNFVSCRDAGSMRPPRWKLGHDNLLCFFFQSATRGSEVLCCTCPWIESSLSQHMAFISKHVGPLCRRARSVLQCFICGCQEHEFSNSRHNNERMLYIGHTSTHMLRKEDLPEF